MRFLAILAAPLLLAWAPAPTRLQPAPPVTEASQIWGDPALPGTPAAQQLEAAGYVRQEVFLSGTANIYADGAARTPKVETAGVPYTTRLIIIRPRDPKRFSGNVQLNPFHPVNGQGVWGSLRDYALRNGDAYVGVMAGADDNTRDRSRGAPVPIAAHLVLPWFDPVRYAAIRWPEDDGIRWDVFAQAAAAVRRPDGPLAPLKVQRVYASGWSFTGSFLRTFINEGFHDAARDAAGQPLIDGYLIGISSSSYRSGYVPINSHSPLPPAEDARRYNKLIDVPVIELMSQNEAITNRDPQTPDSDAKGRHHRLYEVPGLTHGSGGPPSNVTALQLARKGAAPPPPGDACPYPNTDVDMSHFGQAALANLDLWVRAGTPPPKAPRLELDAGFKEVRDDFGNARGGVRPAQLDVPLARYGDPPGGACAPRQGLGSPSLQMRRIPLPAENLRRLYPGGAADYLAKFDARVDALLAARWILPADAATEKQQARAAAAKAFAP